MNYANYTPQYIDYHKIIDFMRSVQLASPRLQSFGHGDIVYFSQTLTGGTATYPYMFVTPMNVSYSENTTQYQLNVIFGDIVNTDLSNEIDVVSDMSLEARNLLSQIWRGSLFNDIADVQLPTNAVPFLERFNDHVGGVSLDLVITVMEDMNACPMYDLPVPTETPICETPTATPTPTVTTTPTITPTQTLGTCFIYDLIGASPGITTFVYTDCNGVQQTQLVNYNDIGSACVKGGLINWDNAGSALNTFVPC